MDGDRLITAGQGGKRLPENSDQQHNDQHQENDGPYVHVCGVDHFVPGSHPSEDYSSDVRPRKTGMTGHLGFWHGTAA